MKLPYPLSFVLFTFLFTFSFAQNQASKWNFGAYAGLDFMVNPPVSIPSPSMVFLQSPASIADAAGNLLFYTDGVTIWNSAHNIMANGSGLMGDMLTVQCMIVKRPGNSQEYYVFTEDNAGGPNGLRYTTVDMSLAAGMGSVTALNVPLFSPSSEKLAAVRHCNGTDIWLLSHDFNGNNFRAYLVTAAGVSLTPIVTGIGTSYSSNVGAQYQMKFSPNGRKIGLVLLNYSPPNANYSFELYDFDNSTGVVSNFQNLLTTPDAGYGCEFSPDGTKFYGTLQLTSQAIQWDLCAGNATTVIQSQFTGNMNYFAALQLAPNGKIYVVRASNDTLGVINNPNVAGAGCNYSDAGPYIAPYNNLQPGSQSGLPGFMASYLLKLPSPTFTYAESCQSVTFTPGTPVCSTSGLSVLNRTWNFGDPASGNANTSGLNAPSHQFQAPGTYTVKLVTYYNCYSDTVVVPITIGASAPALSIAGSFTICKGQSTTYTASGGNGYNWSTGSSNPSITVTPTTTTVYSVTATHTVNSCKAAKSFTVYVSPCTGIEQIQAVTGNKLLVYPNPTQGKLTVETEKEGRLTVYNQLGELIFEQTVSAGKNNLYLSKTSNGIYFLKYSCSTGEKMARLIKAD